MGIFTKILDFFRKKPVVSEQEPLTESKKKKPKKQKQSKTTSAPTRKVVDNTPWVPPAGDRHSADEVLFQDLGLDLRILHAIVDEMQFRACSPIQAKALPLVLAGKDVEGRAQTGTGKTAAFLIGILQDYLRQKENGKDDRANWQPMGLVLAPTRELALQIAKDAEALSLYCGDFRIVTVFGGMDYDKQMSALARGVDLVVATPGRLIDYLRKHAVDLSAVRVAVLDEADRMLDMGFIPDVKRIFSFMGRPETRQTLLFSATLTRDIENLARIWMRPNPELVEVEPEHVVAEGIDETVYAATTREKMAILLWIYAHEDCHRVLIFRNRKRDVEALANLLPKCGIPCEMLSGDVEQKKRLRILEGFRSGQIRTIVATDVAGRGIHVDDVTHVFNYDLPYEAEDYVHRVGRTARAGHRGRAISFADEDGAFVIPEIEKFIERPLPITQPEEEMLQLSPQVQRILSSNQRHESHNGSRREQHSFHSYRGGRR